MNGFPPPLEGCVTRDNWNKPPFAPWSFWHTRRLFRSTPLCPNRDASLPLPEALRPIEDAFLIQHQEASLSLSAWLEDTHTDAMMIIHKGALLYGYQRPATPGLRAPHMAFSITKSLTGLLAEILIHNQLIDDKALMADLVVPLKNSAFGKASLRDCLDMKDGVRFDETYINPDADIHTYSCAYWGARAGGLSNGGVYEALMALTRQEHEPGRAFSYRTPVGDAVGWALSMAMQTHLSQLIQTVLLGTLWGHKMRPI